MNRHRDNTERRNQKESAARLSSAIFPRSCVSPAWLCVRYLSSRCACPRDKGI